MIHNSVSPAVMVIALAASAASAAASDLCVPVQGKITNNFASESSTLGVVSMVYGERPHEIKLKCALSGTQQEGPSAITFIHSLSCDDTYEMPVGDTGATVPVHSSIVLYTTGSVYPPQLPTQLLTFEEVSVPIPTAPARGLFEGVTGGQISVQGAVYVGPDGATPGSIDMKLSGNLCY